ncbi:hypothetical protein ABMA27_002056 [Loxostege sticticalis]|uniref:Uncharacterized protein n=1 Tax=Loxostege sticticalis TaxID=481309 RepID=A0ABR3HWF0_LOXSC
MIQVHRVRPARHLRHHLVSKPSVKKEDKKGKKAKLTTANDIMGDDSDDPAEDIYGTDDLNSYIYRRVANGYTKQYKNDQTGTHYIDLKIYECKELENVKPKQRWRKSILTLKTKSDNNTDAWRHLVNFLKDVKLQFKDVPISFVNTSNHP